MQLSSYVLEMLLKSWTAFRASLGGTTTLGFVAPFLVSIISIGYTLYLILRKQGKGAMLKRLRGEALTALRVTFVVAVLVYGPIYFYEGLVKTVFNEHKRLAEQNQQLLSLNRNLRGEIDWHRHNLSTRDPVFPNIVYLLQAFQIYRHSLNGKPCVIWVTASPETLPFASTVAQFSNSVSGCSTYGPNPPGNPDQDQETMDGIIPDVIVFHMARDDKAASQLMMNLGNQIQCRLSYKPLSSKFAHYPNQGKQAESVVWLQFGTRVKWNSQLP